MEAPCGPRRVEEVRMLTNRVQKVQEQAQAESLEDPRVGTTWAAGGRLCETLRKLVTEVDQQYHPRTNPTREGVVQEGMDGVSGNAQSMRAAWSALETAVETGRGCSALAWLKFGEIQGNGAQWGTQENRALWESTNKS